MNFMPPPPGFVPVAEGTATFVPLTETEERARMREDIRSRALTWEPFDLGGGLTGVIYTDIGGLGMIVDSVVREEQQQRVNAFFFRTMAARSRLREAVGRRGRRRRGGN